MKPFERFQKAAALPIVLLLVALNVIVVVALLIYATTELQASRNSGQTEVARALAQSGIDLAAGLIAANSTNNGFVSYQRVTNVGGAWRLETKIANVAAENLSKPWKTQATNPAVLHSGFAAGTSGVDLNFSVAGDASAGFIAPRTNLSGWTNLSTNMFRMEWIYVFKGDTNNPQNLVGRIAYWTDDESSKMNVNYSGTTEVYGSGTNNSQPLPLAISGPRPGIASNAISEKRFNGRTWPLDTELGGVAGLSIANVKDLINWRKRPDATNFQPFPSVLGLRIGTISGAGGLAVTNLQQQSALGFTATVYSSEAERSYISGRKRYDLMNIYGSGPQSSIAGMRDAIVSEYPAFASKYDLEAFAGAAYSLVQYPNQSNNPAATFGSQRLYARGLPTANEINVRALASERNGTNTVELRTDVELILLSYANKLPSAWNNNFDWGSFIEQSTNYSAQIKFIDASASPAKFGGWTAPSPVTAINTNNAVNWFIRNPANPDGSGTFAPRTTNFSGALGILSSTNTFSTNGPLGTWSFPSRVQVEVRYKGVAYQNFEFSVANPPDAAFTPGAGATNVVYALTGQPPQTNGTRWDPRFAVFEGQAEANTVSGFPADHSPPQASLNAPNWDATDFATQAASDTGEPDLLPLDIFIQQDYGFASYWNDWSQGVGQYLLGTGWLGEVPVTTPSGSSRRLAWSTPRLWGNGRETASAPPDWLLLDAFHTAMFQPVATGTFVSRGRINVNSAKSFFQPIVGSIVKADSIMDSTIIGASTKDFRTSVTGNQGFKSIDGRQMSRTNVLQTIQSMTTPRLSTNNPYTTHFEFLADLAATNMPGNPDWWMAPLPRSGGTNIYTATNTTDRRVEGLVRSLNQKVTTHGNQFSIFSLAQALQVTPAGKTNVVGEAYLQAVYERAPGYNEATGAITNGSSTGAPPMRQLYLRELRY